MRTYTNSKRIMRDLIISITLGFVSAMAVVCILIAAKYEVIDKLFKLVNP